MKVKAHFWRAFAMTSMTLALATAPCLAQNQHQSAPPNRPAPQPRYQAPQPRYQAPQRPSYRVQERNNVPRPYQQPNQGRRAGQWLEQHRQMPIDQQRRALQSDPNFRRLTPQRQQQLEQRLQHFDSLPPDRQQQMLQHMQTWQRLTSSQRQQFRSMDSQFHSLPPERQHAVRNAIQSLRAMPPDARERAIQEGRFNNFSPQERQILNNAARLPLAPAETNREQSPMGPGRYIPRPPH
ncbi:MAG TPA: DUF3106 domain-containing protein [Terriglobales bacterium]|nr:DUF3106 domain-containing protein [Terriglobales bacterium]